MDAAEASNKIRCKLESIGEIHERRLYYDSKKTSEMNTDREGFAMSGFTLVDCPTRNRKETLDKQILVDIKSPEAKMASHVWRTWAFSRLLFIMTVPR